MGKMEGYRFGFQKYRMVCILGVLLLSTPVNGFILVIEPVFGGTWCRRAPMPTARCGLTAAVVNERIYALGGYYYDEEFHTLATVEEYNPTTNQWRRRADLPTPRAGLAATVVNGKIYAIGGENFNGFLDSKYQNLATVEEYDPATNQWRRRTSMPTARSGLAVVVVDGKIYAIGGSAVEEYTPPVCDGYKFEYPISCLIMGLLTILLLKKLRKK